MNAGLENDALNDEIVIDFSKLGKIIWYRKILISLCFILIISLSVVLTFILPKKYVADAKILINKSAATNITELNPFVRSEMASGSGGMAAAIMGGGNNDLNNEIEILKSPLVLNPVIKANNLCYKKGPKKGELLTVEDFLKKNLKIENVKTTNVIEINYKGTDPSVVFGVVNDIIDNYKIVYQQLNVQKSGKDTKFLAKEVSATKVWLNAKISNLKHIQNGGAESVQGKSSGGGGGSNMDIMSYLDKRVKSLMQESNGSVIDTKKQELEIEQGITKLQLLASQYEQSKLINKISQDAAKIIVIQPPMLPRAFEYKEPKLTINLTLGIILSAIAAFFAVITAENTDKKLTYSQIDEHALINPDGFELETKLLALSANTLVINLAGMNKSSELIEFIKNNTQKIRVTSQDSIKNYVDDIKANDNIILISQIGKTDKKIYSGIKGIIAGLNKNICIECFVG